MLYESPEIEHATEGSVKDRRNACIKQNPTKINHDDGVVVLEGSEESVNVGKLRADAAQIRVHAIQIQMQACNTLCDSADIELRFNESKVTRKLLQKLMRAVAGIERHLNDPSHISSNEADRFRDDLDQLQQRVSKIGVQLAG